MVFNLSLIASIKWIFFVLQPPADKFNLLNMLIGFFSLLLGQEIENEPRLDMEGSGNLTLIEYMKILDESGPSAKFTYLACAALIIPLIHQIVSIPFVVNMCAVFHYYQLNSIGAAIALAFASLHISRGYGFKTLGLLNIIAFFVAPHYTMLVKRFIPGMTLGHRAALVSFIQFGLYAWSRHRQFYFEDLVVKLFQRVGTNALKNDFFRLLKFIFEINEEYWQELIKRTILEQPLHRRSSQDTPNGSLSLGDSVEVQTIGSMISKLFETETSVEEFEVVRQVVTPNAKGQDVINYGSLSNRLFRYVRDHGRPFMMNGENEVLNHFGKYALETCLKNRFLTKIGKGDRQELILGPQAPTEDPQQELMQRVARGEGASTYEEIKRQRAVDLVDYELGLDGRFKQTDKTQPPVTFSLEVRR